MKSNATKKAIREIEKTVGLEESYLKPESVELLEKIKKNIQLTNEEMVEVKKLLSNDTEIKEVKKVSQEIRKINKKLPTQLKHKAEQVKRSKELIEQRKEQAIYFERLCEGVELLLQKGYESEVKDIVAEIKKIKIPSQKTNTEKIVKALEVELAKTVPEKFDYSILNKIFKQLQDNDSVKEVKVTNFPKFPKIPKQEKQEKVNLSPISKGLKAIKKKLSDVASVFVTNKEIENAIPVVLVDREQKNKYTAIYRPVIGGGPSVVSVDNFPTEYDIYGYNGTNWHEVRLDSATRTLQNIEYEHHEIHAGNSYWACALDPDLDDTQSLDLLIVTPDTTEWAHMIFSVRVTVESHIHIYENTNTAGGAVVPAYNRDRNSTNTSVLTITSKPAITGVGTGICEQHIGDGKKLGGEDRGISELILKQDTKYLFRVTAEADNNDVSIQLNWYQHTNAIL